MLLIATNAQLLRLLSTTCPIVEYVMRQVALEIYQSINLEKSGYFFDPKYMTAN
jgi:hypothetical protein